VLRPCPIGTDTEALGGEEWVDDEDPGDGSPSPLVGRPIHCACAFGAGRDRAEPRIAPVRCEVSMADNAVSVFASFRPREGRASDLRSLLAWMVERTRAEPGCDRYDLYEERDAGGTLHLFERYRSQEALEAHRATDHYIEYRRQVADLLEDPIGVVVLDPIDVDG
jgi:quinol monooxygenase YgiN